MDSRDGLLVSPADAGVRALLRGLDGRRAQRAVLADAARDGLDPAAVAEVLEGLRAAGLLLDLDAADLLSSDAGPAAAARTAAELPGALSAAGGGLAGPPRRRGRHRRRDPRGHARWPRCSRPAGSAG